ncbi:SDR family oxidoreductase [Pseudoalteromonas rubra]|nr:SDR family oxidoreductase [Pseudoalteromonas rubra]
MHRRVIHFAHFTASVLNRLGKIEDVVPMIDFLASEEARWITGQTLCVNGGFVTH